MPSEVISHATAFTNRLSAVDMSLLSGNTHVAWMDLENEMIMQANRMATAESIEKQHNAFIELSSHLLETVKPFKYRGFIISNTARWLMK